MTRILSVCPVSNLAHNPMNIKVPARSFQGDVLNYMYEMIAAMMDVCCCPLHASSYPLFVLMTAGT